MVMGQVLSGQMTIGTTPQRVDGVSNNPVVLHIHNNDNADDLFLGNQDVTTSTGMRLTKLDSIELTMHQGNTIWAVSTKAGHQASWIAQIL